MPKFIGHSNHHLNREVFSLPASEQKRLIKISYQQKSRLPQGQVFYVLDTSDRGSARCLAKRWNRWYALPETLAHAPSATPNMRLKGLKGKLHVTWKVA